MRRSLSSTLLMLLLMIMVMAVINNGVYGDRKFMKMFTDAGIGIHCPSGSKVYIHPISGDLQLCKQQLGVYNETSCPGGTVCERFPILIPGFQDYCCWAEVNPETDETDQSSTSVVSAMSKLKPMIVDQVDEENEEIDEESEQIQMNKNKKKEIEQEENEDDDEDEEIEWEFEKKMTSTTTHRPIKKSKSRKGPTVSATTEAPNSILSTTVRPSTSRLPQCNNPSDTVLIDYGNRLRDCYFQQCLRGFKCEFNREIRRFICCGNGVDIPPAGLPIIPAPKPLIARPFRPPGRPFGHLNDGHNEPEDKDPKPKRFSKPNRKIHDDYDNDYDDERGEGCQCNNNNNNRGGGGCCGGGGSGGRTGNNNRQSGNRNSFGSSGNCRNGCENRGGGVPSIPDDEDSWNNNDNGCNGNIDSMPSRPLPPIPEPRPLCKKNGGSMQFKKNIGNSGSGGDNGDGGGRLVGRGGGRGGRVGGGEGEGGRRGGSLNSQNRKENGDERFKRPNNQQSRNFNKGIPHPTLPKSTSSSNRNSNRNNNNNNNNNSDGDNYQNMKFISRKSSNSNKNNQSDRKVPRSIPLSGFNNEFYSSTDENCAEGREYHDNEIQVPKCYPPAIDSCPLSHKKCKFSAKFNHHVCCQNIDERFFF